MANKPFEYTIINPLERPTSTDINQLQAQAHYDLRQFAYEIFGRQNGFLGYSFNPEPNSPADGTFYIQQGVAFQFGVAENTFGTPPIPGLVDSYQQKAVTTINRQITAEDAPVGAGEKRYDLLMIRAPAGDERLKNPQSVGIFNPTLGSFPAAVEKYKTLTSSLTEFDVEPISSIGTPTSPIVYKSGNVFTGAWDPVNKPAVNVGYLGVAYIRRYEGQAAIEATDIEDARTLLTLPTMVGGTSGTLPVSSGGTGQEALAVGEVLLGNGTSGITSTAILPVSSGGTGNDASATYTGSVAWFDTAEGKIKYTQAQSAFFPFAAVTGRLLSSNASGAPTWIEVGTAGLPLVSTGTAWEPGKVASAARTGTSASGIYADVSAQALDVTYTELMLSSTTGPFDIVGNVPYTLSILPCAVEGTDGLFYVDNTTIGLGLLSIVLKVSILTNAGATVVRSWQIAQISEEFWNGAPLTLTDVRPSDFANCTVKLEIKRVSASASVYLTNCYYFFAQ